MENKYFGSYEELVDFLKKLLRADVTVNFTNKSIDIREKRELEEMCDLMCPEYNPCEDCSVGCDDIRDCCKHKNPCADIGDQSEIDYEIERAMIEVEMREEGFFALTLLGRETKEGHIASRLEIMGSPSLQALLMVYTALGVEINRMVNKGIHGTDNPEVLGEIARDIMEGED